MKTLIYNYIKNHPQTTYAELSRDVDGFSGDRQTMYQSGIVLWLNMSKEAEDAIQELVAENLIFASVSTLPYLIDGPVLNLPIAKVNRRYKNPHWLPLVFSVK